MNNLVFSNMLHRPARTIVSILGIGLGILLRGGHMLTAFGSSCLPAAILILCAVSGRHVAENPDATATAGFSIMWAGLASLWIMALVIFRRVYRG